MDASTVIGSIVLGAIMLLIMVRKDKATREEVDKCEAAFSYDRYADNLLILKKRDPILCNVLKVEELHDINITSVPDKLVYTGATVGGVTTGGFHVQKGGDYLSLGAKTGKYYLSYKYGDSVGSDYNKKYICCNVSYVGLTASDYALAKENAVMRRYVVSPEEKEKVDKETHHEEIEGCEHLLHLTTMSKADAEYVRKWLGGV